MQKIYNFLIDLLIDCLLLCDSFLAPKSSPNLSEFDPKAIRNKMQFGMDFGGLLDRFWSDSGPKLGAKLEPSWHQNRRKRGTKTMSKNHQKSGDAVVRKWSASGTQ